MTRLTDEAKSFLNKSNYLRTAYLVSLELPGSEGVFANYTTYFKDITYNNNVYKKGVITSVGDVKYTKEFTIYKIPVRMSGLVDEELNRVLETTSYLNKKINIKKIFLDDKGNVVPMYKDGSTVTYFEGVIVSSQLSENDKSSTITWNCSNKFYSLDEINGRLTDDESHRGLITVDGSVVPSSAAKKTEYQQDTGFAHAVGSVSVLAKYQTREKRQKLVTRKAGGLRGVMGEKHIDMVDYWATVTKEVDMDINLTAKYIPVLYGVRKTSGIPVFVDTDLGNPNEVWVVYAFCEGEIDGFLDIHFDDNPIVCTSQDESKSRVCTGMKRYLGDTMRVLENGNSTSLPSEHGDHYTYNDGNGVIEFWTYHGKADQQASPELVNIAARSGFRIQDLKGLGPEYWDSNSRLLDTAYIVAKFNLNSNRTEIPSVEAEIQGKKVSIYNESGLVSSNTTSTNMAWQLLDYVTSDIYGGGIDISEIDLDSIIECAKLMDIVDTSYETDWVPFWRYLGWQDQSPSNRAILQGSALLNTSDTVFKNLQALLAQMEASFNLVDGKYTMTVEAEKDVVLDLDEGDIIDGVITLSDKSMQSKYNTVQASISDPAQLWKANSITFFNKDYKDEDGKEKRANITFPFITNYYTARTRTEYYLKRSRFSRTVTLELPFMYLWLKLHDHITITKKRYSWNKKKFIIEDLVWSSKGRVRIRAREYEDGVFLNSPQVDNSTNQLPEISPNILPPRNLTYTPKVGDNVIGLNGTLSWDKSLSSDVSFYTVRYTGQVDTITVPVLSDSTDKLTLPITGLDAGEYTFTVRAVSITGDKSMPATLSVNINSSYILSKVENLHIVNSATSSDRVYVGKDLQLAWDSVPDIVPFLEYQVNIFDEDTGTLLQDVETNVTNFTYSREANKQDYLTLKGSKGIFRKLKVGVRAIATDGATSIEWTYL